MLLQKTEKARLELSPGVRTLSLRERSLLLLACLLYTSDAADE